MISYEWTGLYFLKTHKATEFDSLLYTLQINYLMYVETTINGSLYAGNKKDLKTSDLFFCFILYITISIMINSGDTFFLKEVYKNFHTLCNYSKVFKT